MTGEHRERAMLNKEKQRDMLQLDGVLGKFDLSVERLQASYNRLQERIGTLNLELEEKNEQLQSSLREQERSKDHLYSILESLPSGVVVVDRAGKVTTFNRAAELIIGKDKKTVAGSDFSKILKPLLPETFPGIVSPVDPGPSQGEGVLFQDQGKEVQVRFTIIPLRERDSVTHALVESRIIILQDVTHLRRLEEQAARTSRLAAMGEIAVTIAHEVRNPLGSIELLATLLKEEVKGDADKQKLTDYIVSGVKSIDYIINNLLLFSKPQPPVFEPVMISTLLSDVLMFIAPSLKLAQIELVTAFTQGDLTIFADAELLRQGFLNVLWNAIQAMPHGGALTVSSEVADGGIPPSPDAGYVEVTIADSGLGIAEEEKGKIFNPFFSTKERGTGLGLAIVHNIVEAHGGMIGFESELGKGSAFTIALPVLPQ